ncbi:dTDP-4-dehydrorhamnose reductase [hydrothermal vent metagenome]|uniref:dTDP-4-dehydrorhamnose reductase n=1 Tax=hydrothermal vent metagenome TaxID=652676 RepID=A0A3B0SGS8_9ZZZZ
MRVLVLGSTGLLGHAIMRQTEIQAIGLARSGADVSADISQTGVLSEVLQTTDPDLVINAAANVNLADCEANPEQAMLINAEPARILAKWSRAQERPFVQISTDHFFDTGGRKKHTEQDKIICLNQYAHSKYQAEQYASTAPKALILRTALLGIHPDGRGFANWAMQALTSRKPLTLFDDFYGSLIDTDDFTSAMLQMVRQGAHGIYNLAASEVASKQQFVHALAAHANINLDWATTGSVVGLMPRRARCLGLDVSRAEAVLGYSLPGLQAVTGRVVNAWRNSQ